MCGKLRNEDNDNIDQDSDDVCTIGVKNIMQLYHGTPRNQNKLKISLTLMLFYRPTSWCEKLWFLFTFWAIKPRMQTSFKYSIYIWTLSHLNSPNCRLQSEQ